MKKHPFLAIIAVFVLVGASAFAFPLTKAASKPLVNNWYQYTGPVPQTDASIKLESNYTKAAAPVGCTDNDNICALFVPGTGTRPDNFSATLEQDLVDARANHAPQSGYIEMKP